MARAPPILDGIACADFGSDEQDVLRTALANVTGYPTSYFGTMSCDDARRRRALLGDSASITFELAIPSDELIDDSVTSAETLAQAITDTLEAAISSGVRIIASPSFVIEAVAGRAELRIASGVNVTEADLRSLEPLKLTTA